MRVQLRRPLVGLMTAASLCIAGGCESGSPPSVDTSKTETTVKGTVKINGTPATEGEVLFDPTNYQRKDVSSRTAPIGKDGTFEISTYTGKNQVKLAGSIAKKHQIAARGAKEVDVKPGDTVTLEFTESK
jgi:hypothetical protein